MTNEFAIDDNDPEVKVNVYAPCATKETTLTAKRFERFSDWKVLQRAIAYLVDKIRNWEASKDTHGPEQSRSVEEHHNPTTKGHNEAARIAIIKAVQSEVFSREIGTLQRRDGNETENRSQLRERRNLLRKSNLVKLDLFSDQDGTL